MTEQQIIDIGNIGEGEENDDWMKQLPGYADEVAIHEALERRHRDAQDKGGPGSGHHGHRGRPGQRGGSAPGPGARRLPITGATDDEIEPQSWEGVGEDVYRVGITSYRPGTDPAQVGVEMAEFEDGLGKVAEEVSVQLGTGGWEGGSEPTWIVQFRDGNDALEYLAATGQKHDQDAVLVMREVSAGAENAAPLVSLGFSEKLGEAEIRAVEEGLVANGLGGWTWGQGENGTELMVACVPEWGGDPDTHIGIMSNVQKELRFRGYETETSISWIEADVIDREEYVEWTG